MLRRSPIFTALAPEQISSGLQPDKHPLHRLLWDAAENVTFFGGKVKRRIPPVDVITPAANPIRGLSQQQASDGVRWLWAASGGKVVRWYGPAAETVIAAGTWHEDAGATVVPTYWDFTHYGNWTIINNGIGAAQIFKAPAAAVNYGNAPTDVLRFMKRQNMVLAIGYGARGTRVGWSDADQIEDYTATAENAAGALSIDDFDTPIRAASRLGSSISVFGEDQMALVNWINAPFYFGQRFALDGIGAVGKMAVASDGKNNLGVGRAGIWWTDSNTFRYIDEGFLHDYLQDEVNWAQAGKCFAIRNDYTGCFEFFFPMRDSLDVNEGWSYDPRTGGWSMIPAAELKDERRLFNFPIVGLNNGKVQFDNSLPTGAAPLTLETRPLLMQVRSADGFVDNHSSCRVDEVDLLVKAARGVEFRLKSSDDINGDWCSSDWMKVAPDSKVHKIDSRKTPDGVYWKLEFRSTIDNWDLDLQGFMLYGVVEGSKRERQ